MAESISPLLNNVARCLVLAAVLAVAWWHIGVLLPFALSLVLAYLLHPAVDRLVLWRLPRWLAVSICLLLTFFTGAVVLLLLVPIVSDLVPMIRSQLPDLMMRGWHELAPRLIDLGVPVPKSADQWKVHVAELFETHGGEWGATLWRSVVQGGAGLFAVLGYAFLVPMLAFYWLMDWARVTDAALALVPIRWRSGLNELLGELDSLMGQYLRGQALVMLALAVYYSVGLGLFGFDLALPIGVFTGLAVCIPYLGFGLGLILAIVSGLLQFAAAGESLLVPFVGVILVYGLGQLIESAFLTPRLVGERIGLHPLGVILSLMIFGQWLGFWGIVIALPCAACLTVIGRRLLAWWRSSPDFLRLD
jgi:predicted PurR-regulated permease PerM